MTRDLALGLLRRGHRPFVYTHQPGALAAQLRAASIPVVRDIDAIRTPPDVIHGQHNSAVAPVVARFPDVPAVFVCHDFTAWHDAPPLFPSIHRYVAVDHTVAERLVVESGISSERVEVFLNAVDLERFVPSARTLSERPARALAFVKHTAHLEHVRAACAAREIALDVAGTAVGKPVDAPESVFPEYDLVFTSALSALEAMAVGCAVIVCDARGLAGFVTPETFERWRPYNFGLRTLSRRVTAEALGAEIGRYDPAAAGAVTCAVRATANMRDLVDRYVALYERCIAEPDATDRLAHDRALAKHLQRWSPRYAAEWPWFVEREHLVHELDAALERPARLRAGDDVSLGAEQPAVVELVNGFGAREAWGVWTVADEATLAFRIEDAGTAEADVSVFTDAFVRPENTPLEVTVRANGSALATWSFAFPYEPSWRSVRVPVSPSGLVLLSFAVHAPTSPKALGLSDDERRLGLALHRLAVGVR